MNLSQNLSTLLNALDTTTIWFTISPFLKTSAWECCVTSSKECWNLNQHPSANLKSCRCHLVNNRQYHFGLHHRLKHHDRFQILKHQNVVCHICCCTLLPPLCFLFTFCHCFSLKPQTASSMSLFHTAFSLLLLAFVVFVHDSTFSKYASSCFMEAMVS